MENRYQRTIGALRLIPRVKGSFVLSDTGVVLAQDMPAALETGLLHTVGTELLVLDETIRHQGDPCRRFDLCYSGHTLFCQPINGGLLCVLAEPAVIDDELQLALDVVAEELGTMRR
jgi:hypothetical protein